MLTRMVKKTDHETDYSGVSPAIMAQPSSFIMVFINRRAGRAAQLA